MSETIYERYCRLRDSAGYKDADVASETSITKSTFSDWKNGRYIPKRIKLQKISDFLGVSLEYLTNGNEVTKEDAEHSHDSEYDITYDIERLKRRVHERKSMPLYYKGEKMDKESLEFMMKTIEHALAAAKIEGSKE